MSCWHTTQRTRTLTGPSSPLRTLGLFGKAPSEGAALFSETLFDIT